MRYLQRLFMLMLVLFGFNSVSYASLHDAIHNISINDINGNVLPLANYKNHVILIVNVASHCGFTSQYEGLQELYNKYKNRGFTVIGVPSNDFFQEPHSDVKIGQFCKRNYNVTFPLTTKVSVNGKNANPLYQYLTSKKGGRIKWNFTKFLIGPDGTIIGRYSPRTKPNDPKIIEKIEHHLPTVLSND